MALLMKNLVAAQIRCDDLFQQGGISLFFMAKLMVDGDAAQPYIVRMRPLPHHCLCPLITKGQIADDLVKKSMVSHHGFVWA